MKDRAKSVIMQTDAKARKISEKWTTFSSLPNDILEKILQPLRFKDKCSLELIDKHFNSLLSNPSPVDGLWGRCDLSRDLSLIKRFNMKEDLVRSVLLPFSHFCLQYVTQIAPYMTLSLLREP